MKASMPTSGRAAMSAKRLLSEPMAVHLATLAYRSPQKKEGLSIGVYGAGIAGGELVSIMKRGSRYTPKYFIDDDEKLLYSR